MMSYPKSRFAKRLPAANWLPGAYAIPSPWLMSLLLAIATWGIASRSAEAQSAEAQSTSPSFTTAAERLQDCTVTIRLEQSALTEDARTPTDRPSEQIAVFTGVCLENRLVVTPMGYRPSSRVRITLSDGEQCQAIPVVIDEFTGLALLRIDRDPPATLPLAQALPHVGEWVVSAAAWGVEKPVISYGIVGGIDRRVAGTHFPPLLLCDLRSTETSSGAPIVSPSGQLHGIVVATSRSQERGWTYAIPVRHVRRMLRTLEHRQSIERTEEDVEQPSEKGATKSGTASDDGQPKTESSSLAEQQEELQMQYSLQRTVETAEPIIVIPHRRPLVGMVLEDNGNHIVVAHLTPGGPAEQAGIAKGDRIVGLEGVVIRSVYQAVLPTFHYQPGDILHYQVVRDTQSLEVPILLGGDVALPASSLETVDTLIDPKLRITGFDELLSQLPESGLALDKPNQNRSSDDKAEPADPLAPSLEKSNTDSSLDASAVAILQRAIENYQTVIAIQNERLVQEQQQREADRQRLETLEKEVKALRAEIERRTQDAAGSR